MVFSAAGGTYVSPSRFTRSASPVAIAAWRVTEGMPQPVPPYPKGALAIVLGWEEGAARCQVRDAQAAPTDPGECARNRRSDDDAAGSWKGESRL
jgi:hypothetical protein